ncbi:ribonuclease P protein subunit p40 isoform X3 [Ochotona curzoniae]|uniref:ribonuclease P protein subunit p40 isoform X3 n=1 Tax=Ochotona curzoniae TaxID=130825 RepID=UPI001B3491F1|nr:ribonuclease P protein subunit p40 isoform X3 [Ochotona curzoniae]
MATLRRLRDTPRHLLVCEKSNFGHEKSRHRHVVETHYYNYRVSFLIPECALLSQELKSLVTEFGPYYLVKNLPVHELISPEFINTFVKTGSCYALTYNTNIDEDNAVALLPGGKLILSLDKDTYEETGLQGRPSKYSGRKTMRFSAGELAVTSYFGAYQIREHQPQVAVSSLRELPCPVLQSRELGGQPDASCGALELFDWLGAVCCDASLTNEPSDFVSTCCCPQPSTVLARACLCTITGFLIPEKVGLLLERLRHYFDEPKLAPWLTLSVQGFADSPVSWREREHGFQKGGEHLYSFVVFSNQDYWLQMAVGAEDDCPP